MGLNCNNVTLKTTRRQFNRWRNIITFTNRIAISNAAKLPTTTTTIPGALAGLRKWTRDNSTTRARWQSAIIVFVRYRVAAGMCSLSLQKVKSYGPMNSASRVAATPWNMGGRRGGSTERNFSHVGMEHLLLSHFQITTFATREPASGCGIRNFLLRPAFFEYFS